jgi:hypothetical protein
MKIIEQTDTELFIEIEDEILPITIDTGGRKLYVKIKSEKNESGGAMPIPPNPIHMLSDRVWQLIRLFENDDEEGNSFFERIKQIELQQVDLINSHQRLENLMNLIIKLLGNNESNSRN